MKKALSLLLAAILAAACFATVGAAADAAVTLNNTDYPGVTNTDLSVLTDGDKGESLKGVCSANEYLTRINLMKAYLEESDTPINDKIKVENGAEKRLCHSTSKCGTISEPFAFCCLINRPSSEMFIVVTTSCIRPSSLSRRFMTVSSG